MGDDVIDQSQGIAYGGAACRMFEAGISDYLEGDSRPQVLAHAGECRFCRVVLSDLKQLMTTSATLADEDPPARLWADVRSVLASEGLFKEPSFWKSWLPNVEFLPRPAPVAVLGALALLSIALVMPSSVSTSRADALTKASSRVQRASSATLDVDSNLQHTVQELQAIYQSRALSFEPAVSATYQQGLRSLDVSIKECQDSVRREPANSLAREYLLTAYQQKAEVLQSALEFDGR
jgi:hypothetical protein